MLRTETLICGERYRLAEEYDTCVDRFRVAVCALKNLLGAEFDRAYETSEKQRVAVEKARLAWIGIAWIIDVRMCRHRRY